ncbi:hypothetical protein ACFSO7_09225 [Bacillus sp. CGMCC 1.16607]|uniref:hypothetical protein n=1 Tax=Bacillus sp. CGMCC 1.16607 TaxID=3351842 RepID=UPI00362DFE8F
MERKKIERFFYFPYDDFPEFDPEIWVYLKNITYMFGYLIVFTGWVMKKILTEKNILVFKTPPKMKTLKYMKPCGLFIETP